MNNETKILKNLFYGNVFKTNNNFYVKFELRMFSAFIWYTYCPCRFEVILQANYFQKMETKFYKVFDLAEICFEMRVGIRNDFWRKRQLAASKV